MRIQPKIQTSAFDVAAWEPDAEYAVFPQGARAKDAVLASNTPSEPVIVPGKRYLFKHSKRSYPDQFWGEIVAYRVGCLLGVEVPPAFASWNSLTGISAAIIEWFYVDGTESFILGGDYLLKINPDFDRVKGEQHNMKDNIVLMRAFSQAKILAEDWRQWWVDALLFDALIGNTDRHQDNWGFIVSAGQFRLCPLFDNGTSLGCERFPNKFHTWKEADIERYIAKGTHHVRWSLSEPLQGHFVLLKRVLQEWPDTKEIARQRLNFDVSELSDAIADLTKLDLPISLSPDRAEFMLRLLTRRYQILKSLLA